MPDEKIVEIFADCFAYSFFNVPFFLLIQAQELMVIYMQQLIATIDDNQLET